MCNQKAWRPLALRMLYDTACTVTYPVAEFIFFNANLKYTPQQHIFHMPTEIFLLQNINGYIDTAETSEGSGSDNTRHSWQSSLRWNKVTAVKLKHVQLLNQNRAMLSFQHLSHFSSVPALLLHHPLSLFPALSLLTCLLKHFYTWFLKTLCALEKKKREQEMCILNPHSYLESCTLRRYSTLNKEGAYCITSHESLLQPG